MSLAARLTLAASIALMAFLGLTGAVLDRAFADSAKSAVRDRLQGVIYTLLAAADLSEQGRLELPPATPEPRLSRPGSGLYANVTGSGYLWSSESQLGHDLNWPAPIATGQTRFDEPVGGAEPMFVLSLGVAWELDPLADIPFTFSAGESTRSYLDQIAKFRRALWGWLGAAAVLLLVVQVVVLGWSLRPLRAVASELVQVQRGEGDRIQGRYPVELVGLTDSINAFIGAERKQLARFRNSSADLAHSLKTPLTVMRTAVEAQPDDADPQLLITQLERMDDIVGYQLKRARTSGHTTFARPVPVLSCAEPVVQTLEQAYRDKQVRCEFDLDEAARFFGESGDLTELLGNLLENAFKWCQHQVILRSRVRHQGDGLRPGLTIVVEDDGPGFSDAQAEDLLRRGMRGDELTAGHGIGLAVVREIADAYGADLVLDASELGGARVTIRFQGT